MLRGGRNIVVTDSRCPGVLMKLRLKGTLLLRNLSTGIEASTTGESLNSGDPAVHPAARHMPHVNVGKLILVFYLETPTLIKSCFVGVLREYYH